MKNKQRNHHSFSLLTVIMTIIVIFLLIICLLYYYLHSLNHDTQKPVTASTQQHYAPPVRLNSKEQEIPTAVSVNTKYGLWVIRDKNGIFARWRPFQDSPKSQYLSFSTIVDGGEIVLQSEKNNITFLYLSIQYPVKGWISLTKWRSEEGRRRNVQVDRLSAIPLTLPAEPIPKISLQKNLVDEAEIICRNKSIYRSDRDYPGNDLSGGVNPLALKTVQQCCQECIHNPFCFSWSFTKDKDCWLKGDPQKQEPRPNKGIVSGKLPEHILLARPKVANPVMKNAGIASILTPTLTNNHQVCCNKSSIAFTSTSFQLFQYDAKINQPTPRASLPVISLPSINIKEKDRILSASLNQLKTLLLTGNWDEQWPIGNGKFGGFVHGTLQYEVNPFSIENFFVLKPNPKRNNKDEKELNGKTSFQDARQEYLEGHFQKSNKILSTFARKHSLGMFSYLFDFSLFFSLFPLRYSSFPEEKPPEISITNPQFQGKNPPKLPPRIIPIAASVPGRKGRIERIRSHIAQNVPFQLQSKGEKEEESQENQKKSVDLKASFIPFQQILLSESQLDLSAGISFASFIHRYSLPLNDDEQYQEAQKASSKNQSNRFSSHYFDDYHYREWFASEEEDLIIGKYQCKTISSPSSSMTKNYERKNCLNIGFEISRETNGPDKILQLIEVESTTTYIKHKVFHPILQQKFSELFESEKSQTNKNKEKDKNDRSLQSFLERSFVLNFEVKSFNENIIPLTNAFVLLYCDGKEFVYQNNEAQHENNHHVNNEQKKKTDPFIPTPEVIHLFLCNEASELKILISMEKIPNLGLSRDEVKTLNQEYSSLSTSSTSFNSLSFQLQRHFLSFLTNGIATDTIRSRHVSSFQDKMLQSTSINLHFDSEGEENNNMNARRNKNNNNLIKGGRKVGGRGGEIIEMCDNLPENIYSFHLFGKTCQDPLINFSSPPPTALSSSLSSSSSHQQRGKKTTKEAQMAVQLYQYGKYLFLSSSTRSNPNLQGIWCDGLQSAWNGDYHLNINLQMNYWHLFSSFIRTPTTRTSTEKDMFFTLLSFMEQLMIRGSTIAKEMYNIPANNQKNNQKKNGILSETRNHNEEIPWVAHGFTDSTLTSFPNGDMQWALCVTCGAWMANHLFDYFMFQSINVNGEFHAGTDTEFVVVSKRVLPIYRGILLFFRDYLFKSSVTGKDREEEGDYLVHSGPTTSPENSYLLKLNGESVQNLALSPSIDISILRQTANIWNSLLGILSSNEKTKSLVSAKDIQLGKDFEELIFHFPNHAIPVIDENHQTPKNQPAPLLREYPDNFFQAAPVLVAQAQAPPQLMQQQQQQTKRSLQSPVLPQDSSSNGEQNDPPPSVSAAVEENEISLFPPQPDADSLAPPVLGADSTAEMPPPIDYEKIFHLEKHNQPAAGRRKLVANNPPAVNNPSAATAPIAIIDESLDYGHRHYSLLHWLFPNNFLPFSSSPSSSLSSADLYTAALRTILNKKKHKGSHTNWSIVWEMILLSRLSNYDQLLAQSTNNNNNQNSQDKYKDQSSSVDIHEEIFQSFQRFFSSFLTNNFLTLHPPLDKIENVQPAPSVFLSEADAKTPRTPPLQQPLPPGKLATYSCETCYRERMISPETRRSMKFSIYSSLYFPPEETSSSSTRPFPQQMGSRRLPQQSHSIVDDLLNELADDRGFHTRFEDKFQIDGNFGYLKVIQEQLVQSFLPNLLHIFPLPRHFLLTSVGNEGGELKGFPLPGNSQLLSLKWKTSTTTSAMAVIEEMWLQFDLNHFWWGKNLLREKKNRPGFFEFDSSNRSLVAEILLIVPNSLTVSNEISSPLSAGSPKNKKSGKKAAAAATFQSSLPRCVVEKTEIVTPSHESQQKTDYLSVVSKGKFLLRMVFPLSNPVNQKRCVVVFT